MALTAVAFALLAARAATGPLPRTPEGTNAASVQATAQPQAPTPRNLTVYMHNNTLAKDVNGVSTPYIFDTLQKFGGNNTVTKLQEVKQDWYLFPALAGNLTANGTLTFHAFVSVDLVNSQINPTLAISETAANGTTTWSHSQNYGSLSWWASPTTS